MQKGTKMSHWYKLGIYFGYPKCCITEFIYHIQTKTSHTRGKRKFDGTGYVPCMKCNQKNHMMLLEYIHKNRQHNKRFSNDN